MVFQKKIPVLKTDGSNCPGTVNAQLNIQQYIDAALEVITALSWNTTILVHSSQFEDGTEFTFLPQSYFLYNHHKSLKHSEIVLQREEYQFQKCIELMQTTETVCHLSYSLLIDLLFESLSFLVIWMIFTCLWSIYGKITSCYLQLYFSQTKSSLNRGVSVQLIWVNPKAQLPSYQHFNSTQHINSVGIGTSLPAGFLAVVPPADENKRSTLLQRLTALNASLFAESVDEEGVVATYDIVSLWLISIENVSSNFPFFFCSALSNFF